MREITTILAMFLAVQLLGLYVGAVMTGNSQQPEFQDMNVTPTKDPGSTWNSLYFLFAIVLGAVFLILLIKYYRGAFVFRGIETLIIFVASYVVFFAVLYSLGIPQFDLIALIGAFLLAALKYRMPSLKNPAAIISSAGVGALFGFSLNIVPAMLFIIGLSVYDYVAVFYTKHMLTLAREMGKRNMSFSVSVESTQRRKATPAEVKQMTVKAKEMKAEGKKPEAPKDYVEEKTHLELGTGDLSIPLMLSVSAYKAGGITLALGASIGALVGLYFVLDYVFSRKTFLPALPPISAGALLGLGIVWVAKMLVG